MAQTFGCRVTGIDLTDDFVAAARELTERCGLSDEVEFHQGDALTMPFSEASFDAACCLNVSMNISDKIGLACEICRVVKPGGRLVWTEAMQGPGGPAALSAAVKRNSNISFLVSEAELRRAMEGAGFRIVEWIDETEAMRVVFAQAGETHSRPRRV